MISTLTSKDSRNRTAVGFSLLELLAVIAIISLLMAILLPALSRSRKQARATDCLTKLKGIGNAIASYAAENGDLLPPNSIDWHSQQTAYMHAQLIDRCQLPVLYGWAELLYEQTTPSPQPFAWKHFPVQRNAGGEYGSAFTCAEATTKADHAGHYRSYYVSWANSIAILDDEKRLIGLRSGGHALSPPIGTLLPRMVLIGASNEYSDAGDNIGSPAYPDASCVNVESAEAHETSSFGLARRGGVLYNTVATTADGPGTNNMARRHGAAPNILFADLHAERSLITLRKLACDWDLNGVQDHITELQAERSACEVD